MALALFPALAFSQPTWNGLRFGMSELEVKQVLRARAMPPSASEKFTNEHLHTYIGLVVHSFTIEDLVGTASLCFDIKTKKLASVGITLNPPPGVDSYAVKLRIKDLRQDFIEKYGLPLLEPECSDLSCEIIWKNGGQTIRMLVLNPTGVVILSYQPVNSTPDI